MRHLILTSGGETRWRVKRCYSCWTTWDDNANACPVCGGLRVDSRYTPSPLEDEVLLGVRERMRELTAPLVRELEAIARAPMPEATYLMGFQAHPGEFRSELSVRWDPMDAEGVQLDGGGPLLEDAGPLIRPRFYDPPFVEIEVASIAFHALRPWFAECWLAAGGAACAHPAYLSEHDLHMAFDLKHKRWDVLGERWPA